MEVFKLLQKIRTRLLSIQLMFMHPTKGFAYLLVFDGESTKNEQKKEDV